MPPPQKPTKIVDRQFEKREYSEFVTQAFKIFKSNQARWYSQKVQRGRERGPKKLHVISLQMKCVKRFADIPMTLSSAIVVRDFKVSGIPIPFGF